MTPQPETTLTNNSVRSDNRLVRYHLFVHYAHLKQAHCVSQVRLLIVLPQFPEHWITGLSHQASFISFEKEEPSGNLPPAPPTPSSHAIGHTTAIRLRYCQEKGVAGIG